MTHFGNLVCECGVEYAPTPDGRHLHRMLEGHTPTPAGEPTPEPTTTGLCALCRGSQTSNGYSVHCNGDGGVALGNGETATCGCRCAQTEAIRGGRTGYCREGRHGKCRGGWRGTDDPCRCPCHDETEAVA